MRKTNLHIALILLFGLASQLSLNALSDKIRCTWRDNPATSMVIAWDQVQGANPVVYFDVVDQGRNFNAYKLSRKPDRVIFAKGMNNHFVRLSGLQPNTAYYFIIKDSEGSTARYSFRTAPDQPTQRLSIIAGGDSRNHREARKSANAMVAKLRPHFVLFNGDMTVNDSSTEWEDWLKDWQLTIAADGHITPVLV
ncbi:MAG TPA: fibronectin type III domain-containing protein, partial [Saprospiraceae bacterium]|nr:fibronectin type III domain-containing protein [Saprospiraceae bacterium]